MASAEKLNFGRNALSFPILFITLLLFGCDSGSGTQGSKSKEQISATTSSEDISWFTRGGSLNKASTLDEWRAADIEERLASAADLLSMKVRDLPAPQEAAQMARARESKITETADAGEQGSLGPVVDRIASEMKW